MSLSEFEIKRYEMAKREFLIKRRPHPSIRHKCDLDCRLDDHSVEIFELRPRWDNPKIIDAYAFAKATYVESHKEWDIYWMGRNQKWRRYLPDKTAKTIEEFFAIIDCDENGAFFG